MRKIICALVLLGCVGSVNADLLRVYPFGMTTQQRIEHREFLKSRRKQEAAQAVINMERGARLGKSPYCDCVKCDCVNCNCCCAKKP